MNWQLGVGIFFLIGSIGNMASDIGTALTALVIALVFLYFGARKKGLIKSKSEDRPKRTLEEETFHAAGVHYYADNIRKLASVNPAWKLSAKQIIAGGKVNKRVFHHYYVNKPVKLQSEPENEHDKNAIAVIIAGELVGYISREDNVHVKDILDNREVKSISGFIGGGEYKVVTEAGNIFKESSEFSVTIKIKYI